MDREKRQLRKLKRDLRDNPHDAHLSEPTVGELSSEPLNGLDHDATRKRRSGEPGA
jgi:hypothetical protein